MTGGPSRRVLTLLALGFAVPVAHPLLIPLVGVPSHLLWWVHVLPVAFFTYRFGRWGALGTILFSTALVLVGERTFGAGYWAAAPWETAGSLAAALAFTNLLVGAFALYARTMTARYQLLFGGVTVGVIRTDARGRIRDANARAREILALPSARLVGRRLQALVESPSLRSMGDLADRGGWTGRVELASDGKIPKRTLHAFVLAVQNPGRQGYQVILADRSVEVLREQELQRKSKLASLGEALAGVAHELKNPLTTIIGQAQLGLMGETSPDETDEILEIVDQQADRMKNLVDELLGFSRADDGSSRTAIHTLLSRIVRVQAIALRNDMELRTRLEYQGEVWASPTKVEQIALNLISNAADAIREGDGGAITVACRDDGDWVEVEVSDDGPGIPEEVLSRVFRPFVTTKPQGEGTGLGLAISRRLASSMGGKLTARNRDEGGASFVLRLRRQRPDTADAPHVSPDPAESPPSDSAVGVPALPGDRHSG